jgi:hypothetical protein
LPQKLKFEWKSGGLIFKKEEVLIDNETSSVPFVWEVLAPEQNGVSPQITRLSINGFIFSGAFVKAASGLNYPLSSSGSMTSQRVSYPSRCQPQPA